MRRERRNRPRRRQRQRPHRHGERQCEHAEGAGARIPHGVQRPAPVPDAEAVRRVGQAVLMQPARDRDAGADGEESRQLGRQAGLTRRQEDKRDAAADGQPHQRKAPGRLAERPRLRPADRQHGQELEGQPHVVEGAHGLPRANPR